MKKILIVFLAAVLILSGCYGESVPAPPDSETSSSARKSESSSPAPESSGYESPYTSCVPEWSVDSPETDPSHVHSTDTSSGSAADENIHYIKGLVVRELPKKSGPPDAALGNESVLERWKAAISDLSDISEIRLQYEFAEERSLGFEETSAITAELRCISPKTDPGTESPSGGGAYTVAAFDSNENELWRVTINRCRFIISFGKENASYVFGIDELYDSAIISTAVFCYSSNMP